MKYSQLFGKSSRSFPSEEIAINAKLLIQGGFIDKLMAGSYTLLPLGYRVKEKIEKIIREEMNNTGAQEVLMPLLHPKEIWNETGRWESAAEVMYQFEKNEKQFALSFTHEEIVLDLIRKHTTSYKDFPIKIYHFSTKFRNELRAKSGILRGREFLMKDLYSAHRSKEELDEYYFSISDSYIKVFSRLGLEVKVVEAGGGVFTKEHTHEFQFLSSAGEDTLYYCQNCDLWQNEEIIGEGGFCSNCKQKIEKSEKGIEVGNIFRFGTSYSQKMNVSFTDNDGSRKFAFLGSYGIGVTRLIGTIVEAFHDDKGIIWPETVAPFSVHLLAINQDAEEIYQLLMKEKIEVLYDDREEGAGVKLADADLLGMPYRLVVSPKTGEKIEFKKRNSNHAELLDHQQLIERLLRNR